MARFGVTERHLREKTLRPRWQALMQLPGRARASVDAGRQRRSGSALPGRFGLEIRATVQGGLRILEKIERAGYDMFRRRPVLSRSTGRCCCLSV